jgi:di/tricarboxylate transporter
MIKMAVWIVTVILLVALVLLITERIPIDLTAIGIMVALIITGVLTPSEAVAGFANPAVITVGAMFLISRAMIRTGAVGFLGKKVIAYSKGDTKRAMLLILLMVAVVSAFINNTPVVVLFIPITLSISCAYGFSPSKFLMPLSYASILAGTCTLIGTSTNIIVSDLSAIYGYGGITMFELSKLGVPIALLGIAFLYFAAPLLMPSHTGPTCELEDREDRRYLAELAIPEDSPLIGKEPRQAFEESYSTLDVYEVVRNFRIFYPLRDKIVMKAGDLVLIKGSANDIVAIIEDGAVVLPHMDASADEKIPPGDSLIVELIIPPQSSLLGERLLNTYLFDDQEVHILAVKRRSLLYTEQRIRSLRLRVGDIILVRCSEERLRRLRGGIDFIIVEDVHEEIIHREKAPWAFLVFAGLIAAASLGLANIMVCSLTALFLLVVSGCLQLRDGYRALQGDVLMLIAGTIALGTAMEKSGAAQQYAQAFLSLFSGFGPQAVLVGILFATSISTQILSNNATAVLIVPIAISTAQSLGVDPKPFIIAVCFGASACFATPIGYQTNLLIYGPGGYRFGDYLKMGVPLNLLVLLASSFFIPKIWPM